MKFKKKEREGKMNNLAFVDLGCLSTKQDLYYIFPFQHFKRHGGRKVLWRKFLNKVWSRIQAYKESYFFPSLVTYMLKNQCFSNKGK